MGVFAGRLREDTVYDYKFVGLSHNTKRGAAGGGVLIAELYAGKNARGFSRERFKNKDMEPNGGALELRVYQFRS